MRGITSRFFGNIHGVLTLPWLSTNNCVVVYIIYGKCVLRVSISIVIECVCSILQSSNTYRTIYMYIYKTYGMFVHVSLFLLY